MEWVERLNQSMNYIEEHLTGEIDYEQLGRIACCSTYHYQRMFTYMAGITLAEYIRKRKMSLAAVDLQCGDERIMVVPKMWQDAAVNGTIQKLEQRIITEWLPTSGYEYANAPDIEVYLNPDPQNAQYEVWIPVTKKKG